RFVHGPHAASTQGANQAIAANGVGDRAIISGAPLRMRQGRSLGVIIDGSSWLGIAESMAAVRTKRGLIAGKTQRAMAGGALKLHDESPAWDPGSPIASATKSRAGSVKSATGAASRASPVRARRETHGSTSTLLCSSSVTLLSSPLLLMK